MLQETYPVVLLERKAERLRKSTGNQALHSALQSPKTPRQLLLSSIERPTKMLFLSPVIFGLSLYIAITYGILYLVFSTVTEVFLYQYHFALQNTGLCFIPIGIGNFTGLLAFAFLSDGLMKKMAKGGEMKPEYRLPPIIPGGCAFPIGLFIYGWTAQYKVHWIAPFVGVLFLGLGMITVFMPVGTYLVDAFTIYAASAMAANTVLRSIGGALLPLCGRTMYEKLGLGWGNSLLAFISLGCIPMIWLFVHYGEQIRKYPKFQLDL